MEVNTLTHKEIAALPQFNGVLPKPRQLYIKGEAFDNLMSRPKVAIVGSRKISAYGKTVTAQFAAQLARAGVVIISGLAYGVDAAAHRSALEAGGLTLAVLPSSIEEIYPAAHRGLAEQIIQGGGALVSEYPKGTPTMKHNFIGRNRIVSGICDALLITEAAENSGTMHTARFALEQGKDVLAVPGNITSPTSAGTNNLIKAGAIPVTSPQEVLELLGITATTAHRAPQASNEAEHRIIALLLDEVSDGNELLTRSGLGADIFGQTLTLMEITGKIRALEANHWSLA